MKTSKNFHNLPNDDASSQRLISNHKELFSQNKTSTSQKKVIFAENVASCRNISTLDQKLLCFVKLSLCYASLVRGSLQCGHLTICKKEDYRLMYMRQLHILFNETKTWHRIVCWFLWFYLFLPVFAWCDHKIVLQIITKQFYDHTMQKLIKTGKYTNNPMSSFGLIEYNLELSCIY